MGNLRDWRGHNRHARQKAVSIALYVAMRGDEFGADGPSAAEQYSDIRGANGVEEDGEPMDSSSSAETRGGGSKGLMESYGSTGRYGGADGGTGQ